MTKYLVDMNKVLHAVVISKHGQYFEGDFFYQRLSL